MARSHSGPITIIGIDYATRPRKVGLALARLSGSQATLLEARLGHPDLLECVSGWLRTSRRSLLAIDSPLGWPSALGKNLVDHQAGDPFAATAHVMFRRRADDMVHELLGLRPLDIGADRIARTAHSAVTFLNDLRRTTRRGIPMAWKSKIRHSAAVIEVYPAATLLAHDLLARNYKRPEQHEERKRLFRAIRKKIADNVASQLPVINADVLDAVVCVLAGIDFLQGLCRHPTDETLARKEGWIWVRDSEVHGVPNSTAP